MLSWYQSQVDSWAYLASSTASAQANESIYGVLKHQAKRVWTNLSHVAALIKAHNLSSIELKVESLHLKVASFQKDDQIQNVITQNLFISGMYLSFYPRHNKWMAVW